MRLLHISDLHARVGNDASDQAVLVDAMLADVEQLAHQRAFDVVVMTGDIAYSGQAPEYSAAEELLFRPMLDLLRLPRERCVLVPGNHDVDRQRVKRFEETGFQTELISRDAVNELLEDTSAVRDVIFRMEPWNEFLTRFYEDVPGDCAKSSTRWLTFIVRRSMVERSELSRSIQPGVPRVTPIKVFFCWVIGKSGTPWMRLKERTCGSSPCITPSAG